jgi:hypothetical protein
MEAPGRQERSRRSRRSRLSRFCIAHVRCPFATILRDRSRNATIDPPPARAGDAEFILGLLNDPRSSLHRRQSVRPRRRSGVHLNGLIASATFRVRLYLTARKDDAVPIGIRGSETRSLVGRRRRVRLLPQFCRRAMRRTASAVMAYGRNVLDSPARGDNITPHEASMRLLEKLHEVRIHGSTIRG